MDPSRAKKLKDARERLKNARLRARGCCLTVFTGRKNETSLEGGLREAISFVKALMEDSLGWPNFGLDNL